MSLKTRHHGTKNLMSWNTKMCGRSLILGIVMTKFLNTRALPLLVGVGSVWFGCSNQQPPAKVKGAGSDFPQAGTPSSLSVFVL